MTRLTASKLRADIYRVLDRVRETGTPVEIEREGDILRIVPVSKKGRTRKLDNLRRRPRAIVGDPEKLVHIDWSGEWKP